MQWLHLLALISSLLFISLRLVTCQFLPGPMCLSARALFIAQGCADEETLGCRVLALIFTSSVDGEEICEGYPCSGYNQLSRSMCRSYRHCSLRKMNVKGICDPRLVCCSIPSNDENGSQEKYKKTELKDQDLTVFNDLASYLSKDFTGSEGKLKAILETGIRTGEGLAGSDMNKILTILGTAFSGKGTEDLASTFGSVFQHIITGLARGDKTARVPNSAEVSGLSSMNLGKAFAGIRQLGEVLDRSDLGKKINEVLDSIEGEGHNKYSEDLNSVAFAGDTIAAFHDVMSVAKGKTDSNLNEMFGENEKEILDVVNSISNFINDKTKEQEEPGMSVVTK